MAMPLNRDRFARMIELSAAEPTLTGPARLLREDEVAQLVRVAYDDASDNARARFVSLIERAPESAWPWSAVQASGTRSAVGIGRVLGVPRPVVNMPPPTTILLLGQVDSPEIDPGDRVPARGTPEAALWEPLYKAIDTWDTATIKKWLHPLGWSMPGTSGPPAEAPPDAGQTTHASPSGGAPAGGQPGNSGLVPPAPSGAAVPTESPWTTERVVMVAGAAAIVTSVAVYSAVSLARSGELSRLSERLRAQEGK